MAEPKEPGIVTSQVDIEISNQNLSAGKKGTADDQRDMFRMGKAQELRVSTFFTSMRESSLTFWQRNFRFVSIFGFSMILMASWETMLGSVQSHLNNSDGVN